MVCWWTVCYCLTNYNTKMHRLRPRYKVGITEIDGGNYLDKIGIYTYVPNSKACLNYIPKFNQIIMATSKKITPDQAMQDLAARRHHVEENKAAAMVKKYKTFRTKLATAKKNEGPLPANVPDLPLFISYNKKTIQNLLKKPGCAGLRIYPAINEYNALTFVLVGVDEAGENMINGVNPTDSQVVMKVASDSGGAVDEGQSSPPYPSPANGF